MRREPPPLPKSGIFRTILWVLAASTVAGVLIAIAAETLWESPALNRFGAGAALTCGVLYLFFRYLGAREAKRREEGEGGSPGP